MRGLTPDAVRQWLENPPPVDPDKPKDDSFAGALLEVLKTDLLLHVNIILRPLHQPARPATKAHKPKV